METTTIRKAYRYRLEPAASQREQLDRFAGARRFVWNWALAAWKAHYDAHGKSIPAKDLSAMLTALKNQPETQWLREMESQSLQQTLADLQRAFSNFFARRARYPRFKSKKRDHARFRIPQRVTLVGGRLSIPKIGFVPLRLSRTVDGTIKSATFSRDACGHWFVCLSVRCEVPVAALALPSKGAVVGIDLGLKDAVVLSTGERVEAPRLYRKARKCLKRAQRSLCRKVKGSKNRLKARARVATLHQKVRNQRQDFLHKLSTHIVRTSGAVCIEDLNIKGLARTKLAKSMLDAGMGELRRQLEYKGLWYGVSVVAIERWYPSSKRCNACGHIKVDLRLSERTWTCTSCGCIVDRDLNAALNIRDEGYRILAAGHAERKNACRAPVRLSTESVA